MSPIVYIAPPGQPHHRSTKGAVSHHEQAPAPPAQRPKPDHSLSCALYAMRPVGLQTTHDPVCTVYTTGRGGHTAVRQQFALQLDIHVVVLRNAATHTVPSSQLQPSTQANVSLVLYGLRPDRRCSPGSVATVNITAAS